MTLRNLIAGLGLVTFLVACGQKNDGGGPGAVPVPFDPYAANCVPYGQQNFGPNGQQNFGPNGQQNFGPNGAPLPACPVTLPPPEGFQTQIPGCEQIAAPVFEDQGSYCEWLGDQTVWQNQCGFEYRSQIFERDCRAYREVHGSCFRGSRGNSGPSDAQIDALIASRERREMDYLNDVSRRHREALEGLADPADFVNDSPRPSYQSARPAEPQPTAPAASAETIVSAPGPVVASPPAFGPPQNVPQPAAPAESPASSRPTSQAQPPASPHAKLDVRECPNLAAFHKHMLNPNISSISGIAMDPKMQAAIDAAMAAREAQFSDQPIGIYPSEDRLAGYITAVEAPFGTFRYSGPGSTDSTRGTSRGDGSALAQNITLSKDGQSITVVMNNSDTASVTLTGEVQSCSHKKNMTIWFSQKLGPNDKQVIQPFHADITWNGIKGSNAKEVGELTFSMRGKFNYYEYKDGRGIMKTDSFVATRFVLWTTGLTSGTEKARMEDRLEDKLSPFKIAATQLKAAASAAPAPAQ